MSWAYWGIVIGLLALVVLLLVCMDILSCKSIKKREAPTQAEGKSSDSQARPPATSQHAA